MRRNLTERKHIVLSFAIWAVLRNLHKAGKIRPAAVQCVVVVGVRSEL